MALGDQIAGAILAFATLRNDPKVKLDILKAHAGLRMEMDLLIGYALAETNSDGTTPCGGS